MLRTQIEHTIVKFLGIKNRLWFLKKKKKRTDYEKLAKDDSTMFLAHSSGYLWTRCFLSRCLGFNWIGFLLASLYFWSISCTIVSTFFFLHTYPEEEKNHINFTCAYMSICGISKLYFFFLAAWETQGQPNFKPHPNFSGQPYLKKSKRRPTPHKEFLETLATIRTVQFVPEMDFNLSFEGDWDLL